MDISEPLPWIILAFAAAYGIGWATGVLWHTGVLHEDTLTQRRESNQGRGQ